VAALLPLGVLDAAILLSTRGQKSKLVGMEQLAACGSATVPTAQ